MDPKAAKPYLCALLLAAWLATPLRVSAQAGPATLAGAVTGPSGAAVPNAMVTLKNAVTGQVTTAQTNSAGAYVVPNLMAGEYDVSVSAQGMSAKTAKVVLTAGGKQTLDMALQAAAGAAAAGPSLEDLGFSPTQARGSTQYQQMLDKRSHMLQVHQRLGLITAVPMLATLFTGMGAKGKHGYPGSSTSRAIHGGLGALTTGLYFSSAYFAIRAPKVPDTKSHGRIRVHKALAWIHGPGMILTPILGAIAYDQFSRGERVHGIAKFHSQAAVITAAAYGAAIMSVSLKF